MPIPPLSPAVTPVVKKKQDSPKSNPSGLPNISENLLTCFIASATLYPDYASAVKADKPELRYRAIFDQFISREYSIPPMVGWRVAYVVASSVVSSGASNYFGHTPTGLLMASALESATTFPLWKRMKEGQLGKTSKVAWRETFIASRSPKQQGAFFMGNALVNVPAITVANLAYVWTAKTVNSKDDSIATIARGGVYWAASTIVLTATRAVAMGGRPGFHGLVATGLRDLLYTFIFIPNLDKPEVK
ncbi:MAG: hypothetical protein EXS67_01885 [Candidatus Margulisbacteria bacterium]|nr:hypothetical protein [Candidatus Margulisiibacteriota bacterium]